MLVYITWYVSMAYPHGNTPPVYTEINSKVQYSNVSSGLNHPSTTGNVCSGDERKKRFPNALLIGNRKAGTRAIIDFLRYLNPYIKEPSKGEVHFFDLKYGKGLDYYKRVMPESCPSDITMEKSPGYFCTPAVPKLVYTWNKHIKLLLSLRDPIE